MKADSASSSLLTLNIMRIVVAVFIPRVVAYPVWAYARFSGKVTLDDLMEEDAY